MKIVTIIEIFAVAGLFTGCHSNNAKRSVTPQSARPQSTESQSATPQSATSESAIDKVRNGFLKYNRTTTIGQALAGTFQNGTWKSFTTDKGATIVEFDGVEPFSENLAFAPTVKMIDDYCNSDAGKALYSKDQSSYDALKAQIAQLKQQESALLRQADETKDSDERLSIDKKEGDVQNEEIQLSNKLYTAPDGRATCLDTTTKQHANDPTPVAVQFSINASDGTFQYYANNMGLSAEALFEKIYK